MQTKSMQTKSVQTRKSYVDMAKFLGIFVVLMNHIELAIPYVNFYGGMFYVPIFFVTAGFTYSMKEERFADYIKKKAKRLLVPYFICNAVLFTIFFLKDVVLGTLSRDNVILRLLGIVYSRNSLYPPTASSNIYFMTILNSPTWFLTALFLSYVLFELCIRLVKGDIKKMFMAGLCMAILSILLHYAIPILLPWSLDSVPLFFCYMLAGYILKVYDIKYTFLEKKYSFIFMLAVGLVLFIVTADMNGSANISVKLWGESVGLALYNGIYSSIFVMYLCKRIEGRFEKIVKFFGFIGRHTLYILCVHMFLIAAFKAVVSIVYKPFMSGNNIVVDNLIKFSIIIATIFCVLLVANLPAILKKGNANGRKRQRS